MESQKKPSPPVHLDNNDLNPSNNPKLSYGASNQNLIESFPDAVSNINVGIFGHVDSGKTSLAKKLSQCASTNAFDKSDAHLIKSMTKNLGFSQLIVQTKTGPIQISLVDCPGHASFIKTVIGGSSIIDTALIVIDITKGIEPQTAECLVLAHLMVDSIIIILNKSDLLEGFSTITDDVPLSKLPSVQKVVRKIQKQISIFPKFKKITPFIPISTIKNVGISTIVEYLGRIKPMKRNFITKPFYFNFDYCFQVPGQGKILTGTVLSGSLEPGDKLELFSNKLIQEIQIKSIQVFKKPVSRVVQGDRCALLLHKSKLGNIEKGFLAAPGSLKSYNHIFFPIELIPFHPFDLKSGIKFHIFIGHFSCLAQAFFYQNSGKDLENIVYLDTKENFEKINSIPNAYSPVKAIPKSSKSQFYTLLKFQNKTAHLPRAIKIIAARLDMNPQKKQCRFAFAGDFIDSSFDTVPSKVSNPESTQQKNISYTVTKKVKTGKIVSLTSLSVLVVSQLFSKELSLQPFLSKCVTVVFPPTKTNVIKRIPGRIQGPFGTFSVTGQIRVELEEPLNYLDYVDSPQHFLPLLLSKGLVTFTFHVLKPFSSQG